jgi:hypothetical protein
MNGVKITIGMAALGIWFAIGTYWGLILLGGA